FGRGVAACRAQAELERYRIQSAAAQGLAARDSAKAQPAPARAAEAGDRDARIFGATRMEAAARAQQRAQHTLVTTDQEDQRTGHRAVGAGTCNRASRRAFRRLPGFGT